MTSGLRRLLVLLGVAGGACDRDRRSPIDPTPTPDPGLPAPPAAAGTFLSGSAVDAISGTPVAGVSIRVAGFEPVSSGVDGRFSIGGEPPGTRQNRAVTASSSSTIERATWIRVPGDEVYLSLIPASFDLSSFDAMFRGEGALRRWARRPALVIERSALAVTATDAASAIATGDVMDDAEAQRLADDLAWALGALTGGTYDTFSDVRIQASPAGATVPTNQGDVIFAARYDGLSASKQYEGYTRWFWNGGGELVRATLMLDRDYDATALQTRRRALRAHELGHALGWRHIESRTSVMNPVGPAEPTDFDRAGAAIAFQRPPLNRTPDVDASASTVNRDNGRIYSAGAP